jgi:Xaa-Pro aminopeptidase
MVRPGDRATFVTDGRYGELAERLVAELSDTHLLVTTSGIWDALGEALDVPEVGLEADSVTWEFVNSLRAETGAEPFVAGGAVEAMRRRKDEDEVTALSRAADAGDAAFDVLGDLVAGANSEKELGWALIDVMRAHGGEAAGWEPIVASGPGASIPHYRSGVRPVGRGLLLLDYGCVYDGYHSDMSRTVWLDGLPDDQLAEIYGVTLESQKAGIEAVGPGVPCGDVDEAVRSVLRAHGYEKHFLHSTGHGVGLEIHEAPAVRRGNTDPLQVGDVVTVEPGIYLPGVGGVRIEDMVLVVEDGPRVLTNSPKERLAA